MQTRKLATAFMVGALSVLLLTFGGFQSVYAGGGRGAPPVKPAQKIGSVQQLRFNQPMKLLGPKQGGKQYVFGKNKLRRPNSSQYPGLK